MANGVYKVTEEFEEKLADYTGARFAVTVDNMSNALFLALYYENHIKKSIYRKLWMFRYGKWYFKGCL
jgi:dTDP-4-amino-4,6-dideoxygalactose transaminase